MNITLYSSTAEPERLDKSSFLTVKATYTGCTPRGEISILSPVITLHEATASKITGCNYCYIEDFGRYYFIDRIICVANNVYQLEMHVDVLYTYNTEIKNIQGILERQENIRDFYINDNDLCIQARRRFLTKEFPSGFDNKTNYSLLLMTVGGT